MSENFTNQDSVLGDYILQWQKKIEERERQRREHEKEIERQRRAEEKRKKEEEERLRREEEKRQRAEQERIRAEQEKILRAQNIKKAKKAALIFICLALVIVAVVKIYNLIAAKHAIKQAYEMIEQGEELIPAYKFDEAKQLYDKASRITDDDEVQRKIQEKRSELEEASNAAEREYNNALRRLQILLAADDNEFNDLSKACIDKMIAIHPTARTTQYFQNMFANHSSLISIQNYEKQGNDLYNQAQYEKAVKKYEAAIVALEIENKTPSTQLLQKKETAQQGAALLKKATTAEEKDQHSAPAKKKGGLIDLIILKR